MEWDSYLDEIKYKFPNAFCRYIRFFNPAIDKLNNVNVLNSTIYLKPHDFDTINDFFNSQGVYLDVVSTCETTGKVSFHYRIKVRERNTLKTLYRANQKPIEAGAGGHCQLLWEAVNLSFAAIELKLKKNKLAIIYA